MRSGVGGPQDRVCDRGILRCRDENLNFVWFLIFVSPFLSPGNETKLRLRVFPDYIFLACQINFLSVSQKHFYYLKFLFLQLVYYLTNAVKRPFPIFISTHSILVYFLVLFRYFWAMKLKQKWVGTVMLTRSCMFSAKF